MQPVTIYTTDYCSYCHSAKRLLTQKAVTFREIDVSGDARQRRELVERAGGLTTVPQIWVGATHVGGCDDLYALERSGDLDRLLHAPATAPAERTSSMAKTFKAGLVQMCAGRSVEQNLIEATQHDPRRRRKGGAALCPDARDHHADGDRQGEACSSRSGPRTAIRRSRISARSRANSASGCTSARWACRSAPTSSPTARYLISPDGAIAARYDKIHMFDVQLPNGESYRESQELPAGRARRGRRPAVGQARHHHLLRPALSPSLPRARQGRRPAARHPLVLHRADRRGALACADARARHRDRLLRAGRGPGRQARDRPRNLRPQPRRRALGRDHRRGRRRHTRRHRSPTSISAQVAEARGRVPSLEHDRAFTVQARTSAPSRSAKPPHDPLRVSVQEGPRVRRLVPDSAAFDKQAKRGLSLARSAARPR